MNQETLYALALTCIRGISLRKQVDLYMNLGSAAPLFEKPEQVRARFPKLRPQLFELLAQQRDEALRRAQQELEYCEAHRIRCLSISETDYPDRLRQCADAPLALFYRGNASLNSAHVLSVVGTRHATEYGKDLCRHFMEELARKCPDVIIVSGLAYGIDVHAHRQALQNGLPTVAVLAHGLDRIYPSTHRDVAERMLSQGGLITEYFSGTQPERANFIRRNRIVAGLSDACLVVESARKGGALITAGLAFDYNRSVFSLPGRVGDVYSEGCLELVRSQRAQLVTCARDVLADMDWLRPELEEDGATPIQRELFPQLSDEESQLVQILSGVDSMPLDQLAMQSRIPVHQVAALLFNMELKGLVKPLPGHTYRLLG